MARRIDNFSFRHQNYPWDEWMDGSIWELTRDEDFATTTETMRTTIMGEARRRGGACRTRIPRDNRKIIVFQFIPPPPYRPQEMNGAAPTSKVTPTHDE